MDYNYKIKYFHKEIVKRKQSFNVTFKLLKELGLNSVHSKYEESETNYSKNDLILIDSKMPEILAKIAFKEYEPKSISSKDTFLDYKIKLLLLYIFFESNPMEITFSDYGDKGFIALRKDGELLHFPDHTMKEFCNELLQKATFSVHLSNEELNFQKVKLHISFKP